VVTGVALAQRQLKTGARVDGDDVAHGRSCVASRPPNGIFHGVAAMLY
jgi:hypothetical protein